MVSLLTSLLGLTLVVSAASIPLAEPDGLSSLQPRQECDNSATSRDCWGEYSIDTNWYDVLPDTGVIREYWLSVENTTCAPDGYERYCQTFNGTVPGPTLFADWGDTLIIHVTNNLEHNGTAIHWHGLRQLDSVEQDGVPGITQCPSAPGETQTYQFRVTQYGSTWYHSHWSLQYAEGLFGGMILNGPATADYDEDLGVLFLQDWGHDTAFQNWETAKLGAPPVLETGLINGTNTWDCSDDTSEACIGGGEKFQTIFEAGKKYLLRLVNVAIDGHFQFSIDGHSLTVIANDLVPIVPYETDSVQISIGQRYDVIVEANAESGDYWLRAGWNDACNTNANPTGMTGIVRYNSSSSAEPTSSSNVTTATSCEDEPLASLVPHVQLNVSSSATTIDQELGFTFDDYFKWTINASSLYIDWAEPTLIQMLEGNTTYETEYNVVPVNQTTDDDWVVLVIQDTTGFTAHPIHLHGHDFWVVAQGNGLFDDTSSSVNFINPPRRDVATLPSGGHLALAFKLDNPGAWLVHCHIAWHASQGLALEFVETPDTVVARTQDLTVTALNDQCDVWESYESSDVWPQDDSGI
ncbi:hypothetical protein S7711_02853 [Stachybotrys chartarum IBT 7711]|uniref:Laccase n=1 Tax=Stachybotrys chartarum (strain CBS 109288 / IBT 7711) TaxID=1280523 RepID=A0A084AH74_STACB|nr:hypothetical protein S7711_02853 [Stachybotrys chartarum IBT 7711]KFA56152.1 hypothetical protein S40293_00105 [Stachybotrys chartarum IBT 40293]